MWWFFHNLSWQKKTLNSELTAKHCDGVTPRYFIISVLNMCITLLAMQMSMYFCLQYSVFSELRHPGWLIGPCTWFLPFLLARGVSSPAVSTNWSSQLVAYDLAHCHWVSSYTPTHSRAWVGGTLDGGGVAIRWRHTPSRDTYKSGSHSRFCELARTLSLGTHVNVLHSRWVHLTACH